MSYAPAPRGNDGRYTWWQWAKADDPHSYDVITWTEWQRELATCG